MIWFQEEIQQELVKLRDEVKHEISKNDRILELRERQDEVQHAIEELTAKFADSQRGERQRHDIFFELLEAETSKRDELAARVNTRLKTQERDHQQLAAEVDKLQVHSESEQQQQIESLRSFQEEMKKELHERRDEVADLTSKWTTQERDCLELAFQVGRLEANIESEHQKEADTLLSLREEIRQELRGLRDEVMHEQTLADLASSQQSKFDSLTAKIDVVTKSQDGIKSHFLDQYLKSTLQVHVLRAAIDKERNDRSQEF